MIICCMLSVFKIYKVKSEVDRDEIRSFIYSNFSDDTEISEKRLLTWCLKCNEIQKFFEDIKKELPKPVSSIKNPKMALRPKEQGRTVINILEEKLKTKKKNAQNNTIDPDSLNKMHLAKQEWITSFSRHLNYSISNQHLITRLTVKPNWVFGINCTEVVKSFCYHNDKSKKGTSEKLLYICAKIIVILYEKLNEQQHYVEHQNEISSLVVSKGTLIASGERGDNPKIHLWDIHTLKTIHIFQGEHKSDIYLLEFIKEDTYLVSCSLRYNTPVVVHDVESRTVVFSYWVDEFVREIVPIVLIDEIPTFHQYDQNSKVTHKNFILLSKNKLYYIKQNELHSVLKLQNMKKFEDLTEITSGICYGTRSQEQVEQMNQVYSEEKENLVLVAVTGHYDGKVVIWENLIPKSVLVKAKSSIVEIAMLKSCFAIATADGIIEFWTLGFERISKQIDIKTFSFKLMSNNIKNLVVTSNSLYFNTYGGDFINLALSFGKDKLINSLTFNYKETRRKNIVMFEDSSWNALCLLEKNEEKLLFINGGNSSAVYGFSSDTHELIDLYTANEGDRITAMDAIILDDVNPIFLYGIAKSDGRGGIILRKNWSLMKNQIEVDGEVKDVKFTPRNDYAICCTAMGSVYVFKQQDGSLDRASAKVINIDREIRISINFCDKGSDVILTTEQRKHYKMNVESCDKMEEIDEKDPFNMSIASLVYHNQHLYFPVIIGQELEYIVSMRGEAMEFWKGLKDLETNCGIKAYGHASEISRIQVSNSKDNVYSLGRSDNCLIEWKVTYDLSAKAQKKDFLNMNISPKRDVDRNVRFLSGADDSKDPNKINRELSFCLNQGERTLNFRDSFTLFRGNTVKLLNALHYKEKSDFDEKNYLYKRVPEVAITLSHVYGIEAFSRRKTLFFLHYYSVSDKNRVTDPTQTGPQAEVKDVILPENYLKEMLFSKYTPIPYDQKHQNCERYMAYFCSRVAIVSKCTTGDLRQKFYEGHRARISCMAVHPSKLIVATGEAELNAEIHVWSMIDCCLMKKTISAHTNGVINLSFSFDGLYLISIGTTGKNYNIQVANWRAGEIIAEVQASTEPILDLIVNPYNRELFSTCGKNRIQTWKLLDRTLIVEQNVEIPVTENSASTYITALSYIYYLPGDMIVTDLIVGNSKGDLGIVTCGKFIPLEKGAHKGMINNIKITDVIHDKLTIITTGEDEYVRFWDIQVKLVSEYSVRQLFPETGNLDGASEKNISVQSIDIFACKPPPTMIVDGQLTTGYEKENPVLLLGTRNGTIIEISLSSEFKKLQAAPGEMGRDIEKPGDVYEKKETYQEIKKIIFHARIIMNNHASQQQNTTDILTQRKIRFTVHPKQPIMVSSGADNDIMFWSTRTHKSRSSITLKSKATCIKFSPNGDYLCIGYENDKLEIISISFENKKPGDDESDMPAQKIVQRINEPQTYILNIEFSESSKQLAVSYLNKKEPEEGEKRITGYVNVFLLNSKYRDTLKNKEDLYIKYRTINSTASDSNLSTNIFYGCYYMSFSANEEYIIINFQQIDKNINKENDDKEKKYVIWDLKNNAPQDNIDLLSRETASGKLNFPNHVNAIYRYHEKYLEKSPDMALTDKQESLTSSKNLTISAMQYFDKFLFFGSGKGDISVVKDYCLQVPPNMTVESLRLDQYFLAKSYAAHCSAIENIEISDDKQKLFTSSASDEVIFEWTIKKGEPEWELDHTVYDLNMEDMFLREVEMREEHKKIITEMLEPRNQIIELQQNIDTKVEPEISLKLEKIIGRKAFNRRNNVYYTANNHLIFSAASLLVMIDIPPEGMDITPETKNQFFKEKFLEVDRGDADSTSPEISTFTLSPDRRYVCAGTIQKKAKLITWELTTNTFIKSWTLENCCVVLNIRYSSDKKRLVCIALTETYMQVVMLIDNATGEILGSTEFSYSIPFRIKDVDFLPKSNDEFVTIGFQHLSKWKLKGGLITFVELPIENPREMISKAGVLHVIQERKHRLLKKNLGPSIVNNVETFPLEVTFMSLIFLFDELMITAGDDGFLYIWKNDVIIQKKNAHLNSTIYCLCASKFHPNLFVSGGMDGCVNLWEMRSPSNESLYIVEKIFEYNLAGDNLETTLQNPSCHIQTLQFRFNKIIAGTRSGDIYFLALPAAAEIKSTAKESKSLQMKVYTAHDHEIPKDVDFDSNCSRIFCITERGLFSSWSFNTLELLYQQKFDFQATAMTVLKSRPYIILTFEKKIIVLNVQERESAPEIPSFALEVKQATSDTSVNFDEKMIAVAMAPSDNSNPVINIYTINYTRNQFELYYVIKEISSTILFMDFSNDNVYLQYMDENFNKFYLDLKDKIQSEKLDLENIEWVSEGLKISDKRSGLDPCYTEENKVTCLVRAGRNSIIAADEIGTIRIFEYPCKSTEYYRIYSHHLSFIRTLHVSKNGDYLVSSSSRDKCIFIWRIHYDNRREGENIQESFQDESNDEY